MIGIDTDTEPLYSYYCYVTTVFNNHSFVVAEVTFIVTAKQKLSACSTVCIFKQGTGRRRNTILRVCLKVVKVLGTLTGTAAGEGERTLPLGWS